MLSSPMRGREEIARTPDRRCNGQRLAPQASLPQRAEAGGTTHRRLPTNHAFRLKYGQIPPTTNRCSSSSCHTTRRPRVVVLLIYAEDPYVVV